MYSRNTPVQYSSPGFPVGFSGSSYFDGRSLVNNLSSRETHWITPSEPTALDALPRLPLPGLDHVFNPVSIHSWLCSTIIYTDKATPFLLQDRRLDDLPGSHWRGSVEGSYCNHPKHIPACFRQATKRYKGKMACMSLIPLIVCPINLLYTKLLDQTLQITCTPYRNFKHEHGQRNYHGFFIP